MGKKQHVSNRRGKDINTLRNKGHSYHTFKLSVKCVMNAQLIKQVLLYNYTQTLLERSLQVKMEQLGYD